MGHATARLAAGVIALATALGIVALVLPLFLNPVWVAFAQERAEATAWTGFTTAELRTATDAVLSDLVLGPPDFDVEVAGGPLLNERERSHMRDVRGVFAGFAAVTGVLALAGVAAAAWLRRDPERPGAAWRAVRTGALALIVVLVAAGGLALVAFDVLFETFHRLFFAGGSYTFDPATERLVQLFPFTFWQESAIAVGVTAVALAALVAIVAGSRARVARHRAVPAVRRPDGSAAPSPGRPA